MLDDQCFGEIVYSDRIVELTVPEALQTEHLCVSRIRFILSETEEQLEGCGLSVWKNSEIRAA